MNICMKKYACLALLVCGGMTFQAGAANSTSVEFRMSVPNPTCNVSVLGGNNTVSLGELARTGDKIHSDKKFRIIANCDGVGSAGRNYLTAAMANSSQGTLQSDNVRIAVNIGNRIDSTNGPFLTLQSSNTDVKLDDNTRFCATSDKNMNCELTPITSVHDGAPTGEGIVAIRFTVRYSA